MTNTFNTKKIKFILTNFFFENSPLIYCVLEFIIIVLLLMLYVIE